MPAQSTRRANLLEAVPDALVGMDQEGVIRFVNGQTEALFGYDRDQLIGQPIETLVPESLWQIYTEHQKDYFADPRTRSSGLELELSGRHQDGTEFPINISLSTIDTGDLLLVITAVRDVTQQRQAVRNAQLNEAIVQYSDDAIIGGSIDGIITAWNLAAERMYGYWSKEIIGKSGRLLTPEDRAGQILTILAKIKAGEHVEDLETTGVRKDGTVFPVSLTIAPIRDPDGEVIGSSAVHRDVTQRQATSATGRRMAAIVECSEDAIIGRTLDGIITSWNPAAAKMFGYCSPEIVGRSIDLLVPGDRDGEIPAIMARISAGQPMDNFETIRVRKDGTVFPVSLTISSIRDADGAIVGASGIARDLTKQKKAFETVQRLAAIVAGSDEAIISGSIEGIVTSWNPAAERIYGYYSAQIIGKPAKIIVPPDRREEFEAVLEKIKTGQHVEHLQTKRVRKNGTVFPVSLTVSPIRDSDGAIVGTSVIHRELTEQQGALVSAQRIVESLDDALIGRNLDGVITTWNQAAARMFGYSSLEIIGKPVDLLGPRDRGDDLIPILAKISAGQSVRKLETTRVRKNGTVFPVSLTISPVRDQKSAVIGACVICRDVTEQSHEAQYTRSLLEAALDPLVTISPDGRITDVNEAAVKATGVARGRLIGTDFSDYFTNRDHANRLYRMAFVRGTAVDYPLTLRHQDGTLTEVLYNASVYPDVRGNTLGVLAAARDVTRRMQSNNVIAEQRARELERLAELERFQRLAVGRELTTPELRREIESLTKLGQAGGSDPAQH